MTIQIVDPDTTEIAHLASVDVKFSGAHIGGGIYFSANHFPTPGGTSTAIPQRSLTGEAASHATTELDYTLPDGDEPWNDYRDDLNGDGTPDVLKAGFDMSLHVGAVLAGTGDFYDGPSVSLLIANDPNDLFGNVTITGYPNGSNSLTGASGVLHESSGTLTAGGYTSQTVLGDQGGYFTVDGAEAVSGMSGGGNFLEYDADGDGTLETFLIASTARSGTIVDGGGAVVSTLVQSTSFSPHYARLAAAVEGLTGADVRVADDFPRMTLLSAQLVGSSLTTVQGQFFNEDIYGGINDDTLLGAAGDDHLFGGVGVDTLDGGSGVDRIDGGDGGDTLSGGTGADWFVGSGLGGGSTDVVLDFDGTEDVIDLSSYFATLDDVILATADLGDGSIFITFPLASGGGGVQVLSTSVTDLTMVNVNIVCFTTGAMIMTPVGPQRIETLCPGDMVTTFDGSNHQLKAVHTREIGMDELHNRPNLWPVVIEAEAFATGVPSHPLSVSPQHRILVNSKIVGRMISHTALVAAKDFLDLPRVSQPHPDSGCIYIHLVFENHQVVCANGCWSESFFPGDQALQALPDDLTAEYVDIFGNASTLAYPILRGRRAHRMVQRHLKNGKALQVSV